MRITGTFTWALAKMVGKPYAVFRRHQGWSTRFNRAKGRFEERQDRGQRWRNVFWSQTDMEATTWKEEVY